MSALGFVEGDTGLSQIVTLKDDGTATNLTGATVTSHWSIGAQTGTAAVAVVVAASGTLRFSTTGLPTGSGEIEFRVVFVDGERRTYPRAAPASLVVRAAL